MLKIMLWYLVIINLCSIYIMYSDKEKAKQERWRTPDDRLVFLLPNIAEWNKKHIYPVAY